MSAFAESCLRCFGTKDLYEILKVKKTADQKQIKQGYHKASLELHPDRNEDADKSEATEKFQLLGKAYSVLSDMEKRKIYDETGIVDNETADKECDWVAFWRLIFPPVTTDSIKNFEEKYKGSDEEREDLKKLYLLHNGDMDKIISNLMCATFQEEGRYRIILNFLIDKGDVPELDAFVNEPEAKKARRKKKMMREAAEAKKHARHVEVMHQVCSVMSERGIIERLEAKYCNVSRSAENSRVIDFSKPFPKKRKVSKFAKKN